MMDYATKPMSRTDARYIAKLFRTIFGYDNVSPFDPIKELDRIHLFMPEVDYLIVEDNVLPPNVPADCSMDENGFFTIRIKESIYTGAYKYNVGGYRMHITHEMIHPFLYKLGYQPIMQRSFENNVVPPYMSSEWQVKAVAGEVMIPFEASKNMEEMTIVEKYGVSPEAAKKRLKIIE